MHTSIVAPSKVGRNRSKLIALIFSGLLICILYSQLDLVNLWKTIKSANLFWLALSIGLSGPITFLLALRFLWTLPDGSDISYHEAIKLTLVTSAFNKFLPAKSGDLVKSFFVTRSGKTSAGVALSIIVYERFCDLFSVISFCVVGLWVAPPISVPALAWLFLIVASCASIILVTSKKSAVWLYEILHNFLHLGRFERLSRAAAGWPSLHAELVGRRSRIILLSLVIWLISLIQMWSFTLVVSVDVPIIASFSIFAIALFAGQMPFTFAGFGARDAVLIVLLSKYMSSESAAFIGVLSALRGILPALASLLIARSYLDIVTDEAKKIGKLWKK